MASNEIWDISNENCSGVQIPAMTFVKKKLEITYFQNDEINSCEIYNREKNVSECILFLHEGHEVSALCVCSV